MQLVIIVLGIYILVAEWRNHELKKKLNDCNRNLIKFLEDKTLWYSGVLPESNELCLIEEENGDYIISKLSDKRWLKKDGSVDFSRIRRWVYLKDLNNI